MSASFQQAVIDVLINKTIKAANEFKVKTIILSGGVAANLELRKQIKEKLRKIYLMLIFKCLKLNYAQIMEL